MKMSELMLASGQACVQAGDDVRRAAESIAAAITSIDVILNNLDKPHQATAWIAVRAEWVAMQDDLGNIRVGSYVRVVNGRAYLQ